MAMTPNRRKRDSSSRGRSIQRLILFIRANLHLFMFPLRVQICIGPIFLLVLNPNEISAKWCSRACFGGSARIRPKIICLIFSKRKTVPLHFVLKVKVTVATHAAFSSQFLCVSVKVIYGHNEIVSVHFIFYTAKINYLNI